MPAIIAPEINGSNVTLITCQGSALEQSFVRASCGVVQAGVFAILGPKAKGPERHDPRFMSASIAYAALAGSGRYAQFGGFRSRGAPPLPIVAINACANEHAVGLVWRYRPTGTEGRGAGLQAPRFSSASIKCAPGRFADELTGATRV